MKKTILFAAAVAFFGLAPEAFAQGFVPLAPIPGLTEGVTANQEGLAAFFNNLYKFAVGMAAMLAVVEIIWGGLEISTKDSVSKQSDGRNRIEQAILGLVLVLSPVIVFSIINPSILNLSINLPELDTKSGVPPSGPETVQEVRKGTVLNARKVGEKIGFGDGLYADSQPGTYCFQIEPFTDPEDSAVKNYVCSGGFNGCNTMFQDAKRSSSKYVPINKSAVSDCNKY
ncbi:MAG TPA: pilin [Candidatus Paceibacterota bacterium]